MKFRFLGGGDCPDWLLASLHELSDVPDEKAASLCDYVAKNPNRGQLDEKALVQLLTNIETNTAPSISTVKVLVSCIYYILCSAQRHDVPGDVLVGELQQLGLPRGHAIGLKQAVELQAQNANPENFLRPTQLRFPPSNQTIETNFLHDERQEDNSLSTVFPDSLVFRETITSTPSASARESIIKLQMDLKEDEYTSLQELCVFIGTWNVNGQPPTINVSKWLRNVERPPDIYAIGFQELDLGKSAFVFDQTPREQEWLEAVTLALDQRAHYIKVDLVRLVGMMLIVFVNDKHKSFVQNIASYTVGTGILGMMGNKGGVSIRFDFYNTSLCFVNSHFAAHVEEYERRNQDYRDICLRTQFNSFVPPKAIKDHDQIYWLGDLNYRITGLDELAVKIFLDKEDYASVLEWDQLNRQYSMNNVFSGYTEGFITFKPTYKYDPGTNNWDSSEKHRTPAWCDRVLWKGDGIQQETYISHPELNISDHKPVSAVFKSSVKVIDKKEYRKIYEKVIKKFDKLENEYLPQVSVDKTEIDFGIVKYLEPYTRHLTITNTGQVPVQFEFIKKLGLSGRCKDWLSIKPYTHCIQTGDKCVVKLEIFVNKLSAFKLNSGDDKLYDILVLHLEGGKDIFITVNGSYEQSCFGTSIEALININVPIREIPLTTLINLERNKAQITRHSYSIPKEIWFLVDHIYRHGMKQKDLFERPGLHSELIKIRDWLDYGSLEAIPGSIHSVIEALLLLLESTSESIIPYSHYSSSLRASTNSILCKQIIADLPECRKNVFMYLCAFLKEVLIYSDENGADIKTLSALFGSVLLRDPPSVQFVNRNQNTRQNTEQQKANFVLHFLTNS